MKYPGADIRTWIIGLLEGIEVNGEAITVYNYPQQATEPPYIHLTNQTQTNVLDKDNNAAEATILIQCVTRFTGDFGGDWFADQMASQVSDKVTGASTQTEDWSFEILTMDANEGVSSLTQTDLVIIRQLSLRLIIQNLKQ